VQNADALHNAEPSREYHFSMREYHFSMNEEIVT